MALVKMKDLLKRAEEKNIGCGAFSVGNMEMVKGAIRAAEELNTPIILQIAEVRLKNSPLHLMGPMIWITALLLRRLTRLWSLVLHPLCWMRPLFLLRKISPR